LKSWGLAAAVVLCAIPLHAQARIPLRVGLYISEEVLAYNPRPGGYVGHVDLGKHLAETVAAEFDRAFASMVRLQQFPSGSQSLEGLDCIVVVGVPQASAKGFFTATNTVSLPFSVYSPSGQVILQTTQEGSEKVTSSSRGIRSSWFRLTDAAVTGFLEKLSQTDLARGAMVRTTTAMLNIASQPGGAQVFLDGKLMGTTNPEKGDLALGGLLSCSHTLRLVAVGYLDWEQAVMLTAGSATSVDAKLAPRFSQLVLQTRPGGVQVYIDDTFKGVTSEQEGRLQIENLAPGNHRVRLTLPGYKEWSQPTALVPGQTLALDAKLESAGPKPLGITEIEEALANLPKARVMALVKQFGVDFDLTGEVEQRLRERGADSDLLLAVATHKK
jgi:hypothetical protein